MHPRFRATGWLAVLAFVAALGSGTPASADATAFSGQATAVKGNVLGVPILISDTGPLPSSGGAQEASLLSETVADTLTVDVLHATTVAGGDRSRAHVSVADLRLTVPGHSVSASFLEARATASCGPNGATASGGAEIADLVVDGQTIVAAGSPNQTVSLAGIGVTINEQTADTATTGMTVNALHVVVPGLADVTISSAHADITCAALVANCRGDFVTGGGWIARPNDARANFAVAGGIKNGANWGHLQYHDHGDGTKVKGTGITLYTDGLGPKFRHIEGTAEVNGQGNYIYRVDVEDETEPGRGADWFAISVFPGGSTTPVYTASGKLAGGNIQLHCP
jgi:hypothetical protein